jgi:hypothetical protein
LRFAEVEYLIDPAGIDRLTTEQKVMERKEGRRKLSGDLVEQSSGKKDGGDAESRELKREVRNRESDVLADDG